ncbi:MAG: MazG nucleotide pyrophosphohydrolase domain-containing protein, partial [Pseudobdellovibrionaceae bacterium]
MSQKSIPSDLSTFESLVEVVATLRGPGGCPWDKEQTHQTLVKYSIEEVCEYIEAVEKKDTSLMKEELGDVLFQVILNSQIAKESGHFTVKDVIETLNKKMVSRHPHV